MKLIVILFYLSIAISTQANILDINKSYNYNLFKNYKKIGKEVHKRIDINESDINLTMEVAEVSYEFSHKIYNEKSEPVYLEFRVNNKNKSFYKFKKDAKLNNTNKYQFIKLAKKSFIFEPLLVTTIYPILKSEKKVVNLFIPSKNKIVQSKVTYEGFGDKKIGEKTFSLKRYNIIYEDQSYEIFVDKLGVIVFVDWSSLAYYSEVDNNKIISFENLATKKNYKLKINKIIIDGFTVKIYKYISKKKKSSSKNIFIIDGMMFPQIKDAVLDNLAENVFIEKLITKVSAKGYSVLRYSFEDFSEKDFEKLTLDKKYNIVKKVFLKNKYYNNFVSIGWGSLIALKLTKDSKNKIKKIIFLNPIFEKYLKMLEKQTDLEFFSLKKQKELKRTLKNLIKQVYSKEKISFNGMIINTKYFKELFKEDSKDYLKYINSKTNISIFTGSYNSEINPKNGWLLYSNIKTNKNTVKHKEFVGLSHYFYKIPYKSFAFSYNKNFKIDREFLKELGRFLRK